MKKYKTEIHFSLWILMIILISTLMSCTTTKQINQDKTITKTESTTHENTVSENQTISTTKITEVADTNIVVPASQLTVVAKLAGMLAGDTVYASGEGLSIKTFYDSLTKTVKSQVHTESITIPFYVNKVTETKQLSTGKVTSNKEEQKKQTIKNDIRDKAVKRTSLPWWLIVIVGILIPACLILLFLKIKHYI